MKITTRFSPISQEQLQQLASDLEGTLSEQDLKDFKAYVKPYDQFGAQQLDDIFLIAELTLQGTGEVQELRPDCSVDQEDWPQFEDEPDIRIDPVYIPLEVLLPVPPFEVKGSRTFHAVLQAKGNIWDQCKDLPSWIWSDRKFEFMLYFSAKMTDGKEFHGNMGGEYARELIRF